VTGSTLRCFKPKRTSKISLTAISSVPEIPLQKLAKAHDRAEIDVPLEANNVFVDFKQRFRIVYY
jgi:hypothetical protein